MFRTLNFVRAPWLLMALVGSAQAAKEDDLGIDGSPSVALKPIGIENCASRWGDTIQLVGSLAATETDYTFSLMSYVGSQCTRDDFGGRCSKTLVSPTDTQDCACIKEVSGTANVDAAVKLAEVVPAAKKCQESMAVNFYAEFYQTPLDLDPVTLHSLVLTVDVDFERPSAPPNAPSVANAEQALEVSFDEVAEDGVDYHQVCVRRFAGVTEDAGVAAESDAGVTDTGGLTNEGLKEGFTVCTNSNPGETSVRFEGLENDLNYEVVYAAVDTAGNRGPNSPIARGRPSQVYDFAEWYNLRGGTETGGCTQSVGLREGAGGGLIGLLSLLLLGLRRRRT